MFKQPAKLIIFTSLLIVAVIGALLLYSKIIIPPSSKSQPPISYNNRPANVNSPSNVPTAPALEEKKPATHNAEFHTYENLPLPTRVLVDDLHSLKIVETDGTESVVIADLKGESIREADWSPDGQYIALLYTPPEDISELEAPIVATHLELLVPSKPYKFIELHFPNSQKSSSYSFLYWSPDSKFISYLVNEGKRLEIMDIQSKAIVWKVDSPSESELVSPLVWVGDGNKVSYVVGRNLYLSTLTGSNIIVANNVSDLAAPPIEGPGGFDISFPFSWSPDGRYVAYSQGRRLAIRDIITGKTLTFGSSLPPTADYGNATGLFRVGWTVNHEYFFQDAAGLKSIRLPSGEISTYVFAGKFDTPSFDPAYQVSSDGQYLASLPSESIYKLPGSIPICKGSHFSVRTLEGGFAGEWVWLRKHPSVLLVFMSNGQYAGKAIVDVETCRVLRWMYWSDVEFDPSR